MAALCLVAFAVLWRSRNPGETAVPESGPAAPVPEPVVVFDPWRDLDGYAAAKQQVGDTLYEFGHFDDRHGETISRSQLVVLRTRWAQERARVQAEVEQLRATGCQFLLELERSFATHTYFGRTFQYQKVESAPFVFYVQDPLQREPRYSARVVETYRPFLLQLLTAFRAEYAKPLSLEQNPAYGCYAIAVLPSEGIYRNDYAVAVRDPAIHLAAAHYDARLRIAVTYEDSSARGLVGPRRSAVLHEFIHALQHAFSATTDLPRPLWFVEGLAEYWSAGQPSTVSQVERPSLPASHLATFFVELHRNPRSPFILPLREMTEIRSLSDVVLRAGERLEKTMSPSASTAGRPMLTPEAQHWAVTVFYMQSCLWMHFLHEKHRSALDRYIQRVMRGDNGWDCFAGQFGELAETGKLEDEFVEFVRSGYQRVHPDVTLPARPDLSVPPPGEAPSKAPLVQEHREPPLNFEPKGLELKPSEWKEALGLAMRDASRGRIGDAIASLTAAMQAVDTSGAGEASERLRRELVRLRDLREFRKGLLDELARNKRYLLDADGRTRGRVVSVDSERVQVEAEGRVEDLPLEEIPPLFLFETARREGGFAVEGGNAARRWVAAYVLLLSGKSREARSFLTVDLPRFEELRHDADGYSQLLERGTVAEALRQLARSGRPQSRDDARAAFEYLTGVVGEHSMDPLFESRRHALRAYAGDALGFLFESRRAECLGLSGTLEESSEGRIRLVYDFKEPGQANDFLTDAEYLQDWRVHLARVPGAPARPNTAGGETRYLECAGATCFRLQVPFAAPFEVECRVGLLPATPGSTREVQYAFYVGVCDDREGSWACADMRGELRVSDRKTRPILGYQVLPEGVENQIAPGIHTVRLIHDGTKMECHIDGKRKSRAANLGTRTAGYLFLWVHSPHPIGVYRLAITGRITEAFLQDQRRKWVERRLEELFP